MNSLVDKIKQLDLKADILKDDLLVADINRDGLLDKKEAAAMITGFLGGKGSLANGTDFNDIQYGGIYYLPKESSYLNDPSVDLKEMFGGNFRARLTVVRSFGSNPNTDAPIVYQKWESTTQGGHDYYASRYFMTNEWTAWSWPIGKPLFFGSAPVNSGSISLNQNIRDFNRIEVSWKPLNLPVRTDVLAAGSQKLIVNTTNVADDAATASTPSISFEEIRMDVSSDGKTLTPAYNLVYLTDNKTHTNNDTQVNDLVSVKAITGISRG